MARPRFTLPTSSATVLLMTGCALVAGFGADAHGRPAGGSAPSSLSAMSLAPALPAPRAALSAPASPSVSPVSPASPVSPLLGPPPGAVPPPSLSPMASMTRALAVAAPDPDDVLAAKLRVTAASTRASLSVAVVDLADGRRAGYGAKAGRTYDTASIVKVDILATLLLKAQGERRGLTSSEKSLASAMIRVSDNKATDALWARIGGAGALDAANRRLGLTGTTAGSGGLWGLTQTTAADQLVLLSAVFGEDSELTPASQRYARTLMAAIASGQDWGVSAAGRAVGLKNGWLPRTATGLWDVNSVGRVSAGGRDYLLAVLSKGSASMGGGVTLVEGAAKAAVSALRS